MPKSIIDVRVENFMHWLQTRDAVPTIRALRDQAESVCAVMNWKKRKNCWHVAKTLQPCSKRLSNALTNKLLHGPSHALNNSQGADTRTAGNLAAPTLPDYITNETFDDQKARHLERAPG